MANKIGTYYMPRNIDNELSDIISKIQSLNSCDYDRATKLLKTYLDKEFNYLTHREKVDDHYLQINYPAEY